MAILPFLATSLPIYGPQVYFVANTWPHIADSCTTSDHTSTLRSISNLSLFTSCYAVVCVDETFPCHASVLIVHLPF